MKKICLYLTFIVAFVMIAGSFVCYAEEATETAVEGAGWFEQIYAEWESGYLKDIVSFGIDVAMFIILVIIKKANKNGLKDIAVNQKQESTAIVEKVNEVVTATNGLTSGTETHKAAVDSYATNTSSTIERIELRNKEKIDSIEAKIDTCVEAMQSFAAMMQTTYASSSTIPQQTKNIINQRYVEVCSAFKKIKNGDQTKC